MNNNSKRYPIKYNIIDTNNNITTQKIKLINGGNINMLEEDYVFEPKNLKINVEKPSKIGVISGENVTLEYVYTDLKKYLGNK